MGPVCILSSHLRDEIILGRVWTLDLVLQPSSGWPWGSPELLCLGFPSTHRDGRPQPPGPSRSPSPWPLQGKPRRLVPEILRPPPPAQEAKA